MKTLAEIAREAWLAAPLDADHWEAAASAVRKAALEEAIEAVRQRSYRGDRVFNARKVDLLIEAIQRLMDKPE